MRPHLRWSLLLSGLLAAPLSAQIRDAGARMERVADGVYVIIHDNATDEWPHGNTGVVVGAFAGAIMSAIIVLSDAPRLRNAIVWLLGGLGSASWDGLVLLAAYSVVPLVVLWYVARQLDLLALGEETAAHLGADPERLKRIVYLAASLLTAASVATCGIIGFVGLVIPHAVRRAWTPLHRVLVPASFLAGGSFLVLADALARTVMRPLELPVGVVTALVGVPLFAVLLRRTLTP